MLALDGLYGRAPTFVAILGTRTPSIEPRDFYRAREQLLRALRRRWEEVFSFDRMAEMGEVSIIENNSK